MKHIYAFITIVFLILVVSSHEIYSQGVAINNSGNNADASAMLDVTSTTSGLLIPRMTLSQRGNISNPATGLMIYQTDNNPGFYYYTGSVWNRVGDGYGTLTSISTENGITGGPITSSGTIGLTGQALSLHNLNTNGFIYRNGATIGTRTISVSGNGIGILYGDGASGNPTISLNIGTGSTQVAAGNHTHALLTRGAGLTGNNYNGSAATTWAVDFGNSTVSGNGPKAQGNFGQFQPHGTYTDFNANPAYWGWNYVQGNTNAPNSLSNQWYREVVSLGDAYPARGSGGYSMELAFPRNNAASAGVWMRTIENGTIGGWTRIDANGLSISGTNNYVAKFTGANAVGNSQIYDNGTNIGIGTTSPGAPLHMYQNRYTLYGPNTNWGAYLQVGGNGRVTTYASVAATNGNLHLDAANGSFATYINYYSQNNTYINAQAGNVGIGTTSPGQKLVVNEGNIDVISGGRGLRLGASNWSNGGLTYGHIITDNGSYNALMIVGNNTAGDGHRNVRIWDHLNVETLLTRGGHTVWDAANDGSGSGLDADLLDGNHASAFAVASHTHPWSQVTSKPAAWLDNANLIQSNANFNNSVPSGFYEYNNATNAPTAGTWYNMINVRHSNVNNDHGFQIAASYYNENIYTRTYQGGTGNNNGTYTPWRSLIHSGNLSSNAVLNQYSSAQSANYFISGEAKIGGWYRSTSGNTGWYSEPYGSGIYATTSGEVATYNGSYFRITGGANASGNLRFDASNPYIVSSSYFVAPGGAYFNSGTVYTEAQYQCRGGIHNDIATNLIIAGGTAGTTYFAGPISGMSGYYPANNMVRLTPNLHLNAIGGYSVIANWDNGTTGATQTFRIGNGAGADAFYVRADSYTWAGTSSTSLANVIYASRPSGNYGGGRATIYGYRHGGTSGSDGTGYAVYSTDAGVQGYTYWGNLYAFGVAGHTYGDYTRTGGTIGANTGGNYWGSLGYKNSGGSWYGTYYTSVGAGGGFMNNNGVVSGIGSGGYGGVMGGWSRGEILGFTTAGELYASYNLGNEYTSGVSADIVSVNNKRIPAYSVTSNEIKVYSDGIAALNNGYCKVLFDQNFANLIAGSRTPTVTVSPMGECEGIHIVSIDKDGFEVKESHSGQSNIDFTWIAVGLRADANELNNVPTAIIDQNFDQNMKDVMFNENNKDKNAKPIWWDGNSLRFDKIPETTIAKPNEDPNLQRHSYDDDVNRLINDNSKQVQNNNEWKPTPEQPVKNQK